MLHGSFNKRLFTTFHREQLVYLQEHINEENTNTENINQRTNSELEDQPVALNLQNSSDVENNNPNKPFVTKQRNVPDSWNDNETKFMLAKFHEYLNDIGPMKRFKNKRTMWQQISADIEEKYGSIKSCTQIENRYKTVVRRKKDAIINNSKSGRSRQDIPFECELSQIAAIDDSIEPEVIRSAKKVNVLKQSPVSATDSDTEADTNSTGDSSTSEKRSKRLIGKLCKRKKSQSITECLIMLNEEKEAAKQARHKEKLELIRELMSKK